MYFVYDINVQYYESSIAEVARLVKIIVSTTIKNYTRHGEFRLAYCDKMAGDFHT